MTDERNVAGGSTDQHVTGVEETGDFLTDQPPTDSTPATGSSNAGINETRANRQKPETEEE
ncbi:hypothetical protein Ade02nite_45170 [Paractinoplanes deccanensis]|uniref:Uncharacterized protein n=1 Tax=Paractinoplanes deccanensis TaxID=113561 RepID=A0ABQ3Y7A9_9ACTN|nr:hypothetical protein [Actinoplanes deccanensis]GID75876.1 hypothetical protein Ade02nite_45170 [Actinoplanes deccanensis]